MSLQKPNAGYDMIGHRHLPESDNRKEALLIPAVFQHEP